MAANENHPKQSQNDNEPRQQPIQATGLSIAPELDSGRHAFAL
jgi:hypothetical protein